MCIHVCVGALGGGGSLINTLEYCNIMFYDTILILKITAPIIVNSVHANIFGFVAQLAYGGVFFISDSYPTNLIKIIATYHNILNVTPVTCYVLYRQIIVNTQP